jgi:hypothetical protein
MTSAGKQSLATAKATAARAAPSARRSAEITAPAPTRDAHAELLLLQRGAGNRATSELVERLRAPADGAPGDAQVAKSEPAGQRLARSLAPTAVLQRCGSHPCPDGGCEADAESIADELIPHEWGATTGTALARTAVRGGAGAGHGRGTAPPIVDSVLRSGGQPMDAASRIAMETRFSHDFGHVRLHTDAQAARSARAVGACAYTVGSHVVVGAEYVAGSAAGQRMLAHELVHVIQQEGAIPGVQGATPVLDADDPLELEAHAVADRVASGGSVAVAGRLAGEAVSRQPRVPALVPDAAGGCGICFRGDLRAVGRSAHEQIQLEFETTYPLLMTEFVVAPPGSRYILNKGRPDLIMATPTGFRVGEIKPANPEGYLEGDAKMEIYRQLLTQKYGKKNPGLTVEPMDLAPPPPFPFLEPASSCKQVVFVNPSVRGVYGYFCQPPFSGALVRSCCGRKKKDEKERKQQRQVVPKPKEQEKPQRRVRAYLVGGHPVFMEYANRMQPPLVLPGQQFIIAFRDDIYTDAVSEWERRQAAQRRRVMQVDPRGIPFIAVQAPLIPIAVVAGVIELIFVGGLVVVAIAAAAPAAAAAGTTAAVAEVGAGTAAATEVAAGTAVAADVAASAAPTLTVIQGGAATTAATGGTIAATGGAAAASGASITFTKAAAAVVIANILAGGGSEAEAAAAIGPLVGTRIAVVLEVSGRGGIDAYKIGQAISADGKTYRAAVALTADESP